MQFELIDSKPLSNEYIDSFYKKLEQQQKDAERLEELEYNESGIITRRKFLQYSALGAVGLGLGLSTEKSEAWHPIIPALIIPVGLFLLREWYRSRHPVKGTIVIENQADRDKHNTMKLELLSSVDIRTSPRYASYNVPAFKRNTYRIKNAPNARVRRDTEVYAKASNNHGSTTSGSFIIQA